MRWISCLLAALLLTACDPSMTSDAFDEYNRTAAMPLGTDKDIADIRSVLYHDGADSVIGLRWESSTQAIAYVTKAGKRALRYYVVLRKEGDRWTIVHTYYDWMTEPYETVPPV